MISNRWVSLPNMVRKVILISLTTWALSCSDFNHAGKGVASETTNGSLAGVLLQNDGNAAALMRIELRDVSNQGVERIVAWDTTDSQGRYHLSASTGRYQLRHVHDSLGVAEWVRVGGHKTIDTLRDLRQKPLQSLQSKLMGSVQNIENLRVRLYGFLDSAVVRGDSSFEFTDLAAGDYLVQVEQIGNQSTILGEWMLSTGVEHDLILQEFPRVVVDAFEGPEGFSQLQTLLGGAWWGMWNDTGATVEDNKVWINTEGLSVDSGALSGKSLHATFRVGPRFVEQPNLVRTAGLVIKIGGDELLDSNSVWFSTQNMDTLVFWAKGMGDFMVRTNNRNANWFRANFEYPISLDSIWTRYAIASDQWIAPDSLIWTTAWMQEIYWITQDSLAEIWLDSIAIHGIYEGDLLR